MQGEGTAFLTSTCALSHLSMLSDLTLDMCVPSLRCRAPQRMHRKMPNYSASAIVRRNTCTSVEGPVETAGGSETTYTPAGPSCLSSVGW